MNYCKYHPLDGATYYCRQCNVHLCDCCINDDTNKRHSVHCFICESVLESLGSANTVVPFWRRLTEAFKYPLNSSSMSLIVITSVISVLALLMPFLFILSVVMYLFAAGAILKYSFTCLERTAIGEMKAPDVLEAYQGGIILLFKLLVITVVMGVFAGLAAYYIGIALGGILGVVALASFPAVLIRFAQTESVFEALNPFAAVALMAAIGLPYGLLIVFMLIMMTSVGVLQGWIDAILPAGSFLAQSMVSSYYMVVMFHLMGYMLFQYQHELGYSARSDEDEDKPTRSDIERITAKMDVLLKEGDYEKLVNLYYQSFKQFPNEACFFDRFFELIVACKKPALMADYGLIYLEFLSRKKRFDKLTSTFKQICFLLPDYLPNSPVMKVQLATFFRQQGDLKLAVKMLNGMHKLHPEFEGLPAAYTLLSDCLGDLPGMQVQAEKCRQMAEQLARRADAKKMALEQQRLAQQTAVTNNSVPPKTGRRGPPKLTSSGLTLELVPLDNVSADKN